MGLIRQIARGLGLARPKPITASEQDNPQEASLILKCLPPEIRCQIWSAYFHPSETNIVHILHQGDAASECIAIDRSIRSARTHSACHGERHSRNRINLILTCKRIYFEAVFCLYDSTLFDFSDSNYAVSAFRKRIPAWHFASISQATISFLGNAHTPTSPTGRGAKFELTKQWPIMWQSLAAMESLRWLRFDVLLVSPTHDGKHWRRDIDNVLGPMMLVTQPSYFELVLPFEVDDWAEKLPCHVIRFDETPAWGIDYK